MFKLNVQPAFKKPYFVINCYDKNTRQFKTTMSFIFDSHESASLAVKQYEFMYGDCLLFIIREVIVYKCDTNLPISI